MLPTPPAASDGSNAPLDREKLLTYLDDIAFTAKYRHLAMALAQSIRDGHFDTTENEKS